MLGALYSLHNTHIIVCFPYPPIHRKSSCSLLVFYTIDSAITRSLTGSFWVYRCSCFGFVHTTQSERSGSYEAWTNVKSFSHFLSFFALVSLSMIHMRFGIGKTFNFFSSHFIFWLVLRATKIAFSTALYTDVRWFSVCALCYSCCCCCILFAKNFFFVYFHMAGEIECSPFSILMRKTESGYLHLICCCYTASSVQIFFVSCKSEWCVPYEWMVHVLLNITRTQLQATEKRSILLW